MRPDARLALTEHFENYFNTPVLQLYQPAIIHGDLEAAISWSKTTRSAASLIFSSVCYSDPALDIASLYTYGEPFFSHFVTFTR